MVIQLDSRKLQPPRHARTCSPPGLLPLTENFDSPCFPVSCLLVRRSVIPEFDIGKGELAGILCWDLWDPATGRETRGPKLCETIYKNPLAPNELGYIN